MYIIIIPDLRSHSNCKVSPIVRACVIRPSESPVWSHKTKFETCNSCGSRCLPSLSFRYGIWRITEQGASKRLGWGHSWYLCDLWPVRLSPLSITVYEQYPSPPPVLLLAAGPLYSSDTEVQDLSPEVGTIKSISGTSRGPVSVLLTNDWPNYQCEGSENQCFHRWMTECSFNSLAKVVLYEAREGS